MNSHLPLTETIDHLFRKEWGKLVATLTKVFGVHNLQMAEDVVQDTLLTALNNWKINGLPNNPTAWLYTAAKNKAIDLLRKQSKTSRYINIDNPLLQSEYTLAQTMTDLVSTNDIDDDQLKMMFVCCNPALSNEAQVAMVLKTLCGFSVTEIAKAFLSKYDTIEKRLYRAKQVFKEKNIEFDLPNKESLLARTETVLLVLYLVFNEGYNSTEHSSLIRNDLMDEAMRLCRLLCNSKKIPKQNAMALNALMCFTAARNKARIDKAGNILLLKQQNRSLWDTELIHAGIFYLEQSADGDSFSKYHLEAGIAYEHARAETYDKTNWQNILNWYNLLNELYPSPVVALNRAIIVAEIEGAAKAIETIQAIPQLSWLKNYYLLPATLGELYTQLGETEKAKACFKEAIQLTKAPKEKKLLEEKLKML